MTTDRAAAYHAIGGVGEPPVLKEDLYERVQILRAWIHDVDWEALCRSHPPAKNWFNDVGEPSK